MLQKIIDIYVWFFAKPCFKKFNKLLFRLSLAGLGILNYKNNKASGESHFLNNYLAKKMELL